MNIAWASDTQRQAFEYGPFPQVASGGWGSGKTFLYCLKALWLSDTFAKNRGVIARKVAKELRATTMATFYKLCPPASYAKGRRDDNAGLLQFNNGSEILFMHLDNPELHGILRGLEINWFFIDQAEEDPEHMEENFDLLTARLGRWDVTTVPDELVAEEAAAGRAWKWRYPTNGLPMPPPFAMLAVNPDTELHWVYRRFHPDSHEFHEKWKAHGYRLFHMPSTDNQFLSDVNREALLSKDDSFVRRYVRGEWGMPEGRIHTVDGLSLVDGTPELLDYFRRACTLHRALDHGDTSPTCCLWFAVDREHNVFVYREYYRPNALISTHRSEITSLSEGERYQFNLADPSIFAKTMQVKRGGRDQRWSVAEEYADTVEQDARTALYWSGADNNELGTRNRINEYLHVDRDRIHPITKQPGAPRIFFVTPGPQYPNGCMRVLTQTRSQRREKVGVDGGRPVYSDERDENVTDHAYDPLRYFIASRAPLPSPLAPSTAGTFDAYRKLTKQFRQKVGA